jgi:hypothetical protein
MISNNTMLIVGAILILVFLYFYNKDDIIENEGEMVVSAQNTNKKHNDEDTLINELLAESNVSGDALSGIGSDSDADNQVVEYKNKKFYAPDANSSKKLFKVKDYLPQEKHDEWWDVPSTTVKIDDANLIDNKDFIGVNTVGSSLRNANRDFRPAPPCPRITVSPWNQSTIEPDINTRSLC